MMSVYFYSTFKAVEEGGVKNGMENTAYKKKSF